MHCLHCRRLVLLRLGTLPSSPHRSHRRPLVVQSQLSSQPVGSYHSVACLLAWPGPHNAGALSICFIYARCPSVSVSLAVTVTVLSVDVALRLISQATTCCEALEPSQWTPKVLPLKWSPQSAQSQLPSLPLLAPSLTWQHFGSRAARVGIPNIPKTNCQYN